MIIIRFSNQGCTDLNIFTNMLGCVQWFCLYQRYVQVVNKKEKKILLSETRTFFSFCHGIKRDFLYITSVVLKFWYHDSRV